GEPMSTAPAAFTLRAFLDEVAADDPQALLRVREPVALDYEATALVMEMEKRGRAPVVWFDQVEGSRFPVVVNLFGARRRYALALGVPTERLIEEWAARNDRTIEPIMRQSGAIHDVVVTGEDVDLAALPIMRHFANDAGPYITNAIIVAKDPDTGVRNT